MSKPNQYGNWNCACWLCDNIADEGTCDLCDGDCEKCNEICNDPCDEFKYMLD